MAAMFQNPTRNFPKSQTQKRTNQQTRSRLINNSKEIRKSYGAERKSQNTMPKPSLISRRRPFELVDHDTYLNQKQPSDIQPVTMRKNYSPMQTPPRLRALASSPTIGSYRNNLNLRRIASPLPVISDFYSPGINLDTWGVTATDYASLNLMRRHPTPLSSFNYRQRKPYIVVPRLTNLITPPVSNYSTASFRLPTRRLSPIYIPNSQYRHFERIDSFTSPRFYRAPSDYVYVRKNEAFANDYVENFIGKYVEDEFIPDILKEVIREIDQESRSKGGRSYQSELDRYYAELNQRRKQQLNATETHLFSDEWIHQLDYQRPSVLVPMNRVRFHELPTDVQGRLLADINQEMIEHDINNLTGDLGYQTLTTTRTHSVPLANEPRIDTYRDSYSETIHRAQYNTQRIDPQMAAYTENKLLDAVCLDRLIYKYLKQTDSGFDNDELSRLLDVTLLQNLIGQCHRIDEYRSRTLDNYATKKFHMNSYMNATMDFLLTELSGSLIEDMKDLDVQERKSLFYRI